MNRDDIISMAKEAGAGMLLHGESCLMGDVAIVRFANIISAAEREACAKVCDHWPYGRDDVWSLGQAIRARGQA